MITFYVKSQNPKSEANLLNRLGYTWRNGSKISPDEVSPHIKYWRVGIQPDSLKCVTRAGEIEDTSIEVLTFDAIFLYSKLKDPMLYHKFGDVSIYSNLYRSGSL